MEQVMPLSGFRCLWGRVKGSEFKAGCTAQFPGRSVLIENQSVVRGDVMTLAEQEELSAIAMEAMEEGDTAYALSCFERLLAEDRRPQNISCLAYCVARERGEIKRGISLCKNAIREEPKNARHFLWLGRIHLLAGQKKDAVRIFRMGLRHQRCADIQKELNQLGVRQNPPVPFLRRENPVNMILGKAL